MSDPTTVSVPNDDQAMAVEEPLEDDIDLAAKLTRQLKEECLAMAEYAFQNGLPIGRSALISLRDIRD